MPRLRLQDNTVRKLPAKRLCLLSGRLRVMGRRNALLSQPAVNTCWSLHRFPASRMTLLHRYDLQELDDMIAGVAAKIKVKRTPPPEQVSVGEDE